jgi:uncharacterized protein (TIGR02391 family)
MQVARQLSGAAQRNKTGAYLMSLSTSIDSRLWASVQSAYEAGNYSAAILDSVHYLSELIRNKSGLDSDGHTLVGSALGGKNPIIKVNNLHTETDKNEQLGVEHLLRGVYSAIRNPRSHEKRTDTCEVADVIISFVSYLAGLIDKSRSPFDTQEIIERVFDRHFAQSDKYADLLVERIPSRKLLDVVLALFARRKEGKTKSVVRFSKAVLRKLSAEEQVTYWDIVSEALESASSDDDFRTAIQIAKDDWLKVSQIARLRAEHRLIESSREGEYNKQDDLCPKGALGTWAQDIAKEFTLQQEFVDAVSFRLLSGNPAAAAYVFHYHFVPLRQLRPNPPFEIVSFLKKRLREHDGDVYEALDFLAWHTEETGWEKALKTDYDEFQFADPVHNIEIMDDDIPF